MRAYVEPTTKENAIARLFFRFFVCYALVALLAFLVCYNTSTLPPQTHANALQCTFFALAALSAFTTISIPLLTVTTACKAVFDIGALLDTIGRYKGSITRIVLTNFAFFHLTASALLFCALAANAELFSHTNYKRNAELLLSRTCFSFLLRAALLLALALFFYLLIPQLAFKFR